MFSHDATTTAEAISPLLHLPDAANTTALPSASASVSCLALRSRSDLALRWDVLRFASEQATPATKKATNTTDDDSVENFEDGVAALLGRGRTASADSPFFAPAHAAKRNILACHLPSLLPPCQAGHPAEARTDRCAFPTLNSSRPSPSREACPVHESQRVGDTSVLLVSALLPTPTILQSSREFTITRLRVLDDARQRKCTPPLAFCRFLAASLLAAGCSRVSQSRLLQAVFADFTLPRLG